jgi:hypothetical protein
MSQAAWAVVEDGKIDIRTISDSQRGAMVLSLAIKGHPVLPAMTDEDVAKLWWRHNQRSTIDMVFVSQRGGSIVRYGYQLTICVDEATWKFVKACVDGNRSSVAAEARRLIEVGQRVSTNAARGPEPSAGG